MTKTSKILLLTLTLLLMCVGTIQAENLDEQVFHFINWDMQSTYLDMPMLLVTHTGDGLTQALAAGGFYLAGEKDTATLLASALLKTEWTTVALKYAFHRPRPGLGLGTENVHYVGDYQMLNDKSFPSGHTTSSFAVATVLSHQYPKYTPYFYAYASLVGISRIYTGSHYPTDVLAGAALGYLIGWSTVRNENLILNGHFLVYSIKF